MKVYCKTCNREFIKDKRRVFCSTECRIKDITKREKYIFSQKKYLEKQRKLKYNTWEKYLAYLLKKPERIKCNLTVDKVLWVLKEQDFKCALSGIPLNHSENSLYSVSIDRKIPKGTYDISNIQLVCKCINVLRRDTSLEEFINICKKIAEKNS